jgi:hypothetical protein
MSDDSTTDSPDLLRSSNSQTFQNRKILSPNLFSPIRPLSQISDVTLDILSKLDSQLESYPSKRRSVVQNSLNLTQNRSDNLKRSDFNKNSQLIDPIDILKKLPWHNLSIFSVSQNLTMTELKILLRYKQCDVPPQIRKETLSEKLISLIHRNKFKHEKDKIFSMVDVSSTSVSQNVNLSPFAQSIPLNVDNQCTTKISTSSVVKPTTSDVEYKENLEQNLIQASSIYYSPEISNSDNWMITTSNTKDFSDFTKNENWKAASKGDPIHDDIVIIPTIY